MNPSSECLQVTNNAEYSLEQGRCGNEVEAGAVIDSTDPDTPMTTARSKGAFLPKLDCMTKAPSEAPESRVSFSPAPYPESVPSPAASEDAEDVKSPRRSRRARRPPRPKEVEEYINHIRLPSLTSASLSTPPSSPLPQGQEREVIATPSRKRSGSVRAEKITLATLTAAAPMTAPTTVAGVAVASSLEDSKCQVSSLSVPSTPSASTPSTPSTPTTTFSRKSTQDLDLASIPGVVTTQRVRRPPQNLAEFVSSEDFKAAPCGRRQERTQQVQSSDLSRDKKRSKSEGQLSCSGKKFTTTDIDHPMEVRQQFETDPVRSASLPDLSAVLEPKPGTQPAIIPLSALSHSKRSSHSLSYLSSKRQRRDGSGRSRPPYSKRHSSHQFLSREEILERRRRDGKREIMVASEDDWSDSDFDFLRDEQENYRLMCVRARKTQMEQSRWNVRDRFQDSYADLSENEDLENTDDDQHRVEGEKIKLLMDPSVINYGFDSGDGEYILDYHQGPLFNNVTWPEFSDAKEVNRGNGNATVTSASHNGSTHNGLAHSIVPTPAAATPDDMDLKLTSDIIPGFTRAIGLESDSNDFVACVPRTRTPVSSMDVSNACDSGEIRKQDADEWSLFVGSCGPKMEGNSGPNRRAETDTVGKSLPSLEQPLPEAEIAAAVAVAVAVAAVSANDVTEEHVQMEEIEIHTTSAGGGREEIEAEDFIGWSLCE